MHFNVHLHFPFQSWFVLFSEGSAVAVASCPGVKAQLFIIPATFPKLISVQRNLSASPSQKTAVPRHPLQNKTADQKMATTTLARSGVKVFSLSRSGLPKQWRGIVSHPIEQQQKRFKSGGS